MGLVGTTPAAGPVLLTGDAAGLVNPLQGEGIAHAMTSGRLAAEAVLAGPATAAARYRQGIAGAHLDFHRIAAAAHAGLVGRPAAASVVGRLLTHPLVGRAVAGGWSDLLERAPRRRPAGAGAFPGRCGVGARPCRDPPSATGRWLDRVWAPAPGAS